VVNTVEAACGSDSSGSINCDPVTKFGSRAMSLKQCPYPTTRGFPEAVSQSAFPRGSPPGSNSFDRAYNRKIVDDRIKKGASFL